MSDLRDLLRDYCDGDLIAIAGIIDAASDALSDADLSDRRRQTYEQIRDALTQSVRSGDTDSVDALIAEWLRELDDDKPSSGDRPVESVEPAAALSFLANAVGHLSTIVDLLKRYRPGDLTLATEILAETQQLASDDRTPESAQPIIHSIRDTFFEYVRSGVVDGPDEPDEPAPGPAVEPTVAALAASAPPAVAASAVEPVGESPASAPADAPPTSDRVVRVDDMDIVRSFIEESVDHLDSIETRVLKLEHEYSDDLVNTIFRSMHTIKGVASFVGFQYVSELSHELETILDDVRTGVREVDDTLVTTLLDGTDVVAQIVRSIEEQVRAADGPVDALVEQSLGHRELVLRIRRLRGIAVEPISATGSAPAPESVQFVDTASEAGEESDATRADAPIVTPDMVDAFVEESSDLLDQVEQALLAAENNPVSGPAVDHVFRSIHTIKGNAGFFWFAKVEQRCMTMESALDAFRKAGAPIDHPAASEFLEMVDAIRQDVAAIADASARDDSAAVARQQQPDAVAPGYSDALGDILVEMGALTHEQLQSALTSQQRRLGEILVTEEHIAPDSVAKALEVQAQRRMQSGTTGETTVARKDIRVDTTKLDKLFELVGELITAESMVIGGLSGVTNGAGQGDGGSSTVQKAASYLQKITREMQEITLSIRMIPLEATFGKMRRLVRDLARKFEKEVQIQISGEQTEMDKNVIEEVSDPLVHIIRNAVDHGIEPPDERVAAGKPAAGTIDLTARHEGNEIWITIRDDGRGLRRDRILAKARERGLLADGDPDPPDETVWRYIFEPAFSTADQVSEISGRGVGMDVVRQNVEKLRGKIDIDSAPGSGTTIVLRIPLTLAILDGVTFTIGSTQYSVPTGELVTFQGYHPDAITRTGPDHHGFRLRDEVIPIVQYENRGPIPEHGVIIVVQSGVRRAAIVVDRIIGYRQFVVRAVPDYIQNMRAVSGCSIQGDGSISFIIDVGELMDQELVHVGSR
ncbi:MAG: chemotaxis protein CheA [Spirochaetaceae bacterium]|nr:MAG: chemotaxis protein CheA [Spirochaetaceae bacterium]